MSRFLPRIVPLLFLGLLCATVPATAQEDNPRPNKAKSPEVFAVVSVASFDRLLGEVETVLGLVDRSDLVGFIRGGLGAVNNLEGLDRSKPLGAAITLGDGFPPQPRPVVFVPVADFEKLARSVAIGPVKLSASEDDPKVVTLDFGEDQVYARRAHGYLFFGESLDAIPKRLPDPADLVGTLPERYDIALAMHPQKVPQAAKFMLLDAVKSQMEADSGKRDGERERDYQFRRALETDLYSVFADFLNDGQEVALGWKVTEDQAVLEFAIDSGETGKLANVFGQMQEAASQPRPTFGGKAPGSATAQITLPAYPPLNDLLRSAVDDGMIDLRRSAGGEAAEQIDRLENAARANLFPNGYRVDMSLRRDPPNPPVVLMTTPLADADAVRTSLIDLARYGESEGMEISRSTEERSGALVYGAEDVEGGKNEFNFLTVTGGRLWFAHGPESAGETLSEALGQEPTTAAPNAVASLTVRLADFQDELTKENPDLRPLAARAFSRGEDEVSVVVTAKRDGMTARVTLAQGVLKFVGYALAAGLDRGN